MQRHVHIDLVVHRPLREWASRGRLLARAGRSTPRAEWQGLSLYSTSVRQLSGKPVKPTTHEDCTYLTDRSTICVTTPKPYEIHLNSNYLCQNSVQAVYFASLDTGYQNSE